MKKLFLLIGLFVLVSGSVLGKTYEVYCGNDSRWYFSDGVLEEIDEGGVGFNFEINLDKSFVRINGFLLGGKSYDRKTSKETIQDVKDGIIHYFTDGENGRTFQEIDMINLQLKTTFSWRENYRIIKYCEKNIELANYLGIKSKSLKELKEEQKLAEQEAIRLEQEAEAQEQVDAQQKKMETCEAYGFEKGSEPFGQCIFKLMELDLEYAKLENERLRLQAQAEQAELNNQAALAQSLAAQAQASNRDKALRIQQFGLAMQGIANSFQTPSSMANPKITCHNFGTQMKCW